ncbi:MAG: HisA/HisF-related TIM barrel protein [Pseudolysinimonas sp.]
MLSVRPRVIPALLLENDRFVKTRRFEDPQYVGDPVNVLSIFNDLEVDEMLLLDIGAARGAPIQLDYLRRLTTECFVPLAYGGGVGSVEQADRLVREGFEKIVFNTTLLDSPEIVADAVRALGAQAVIAAVDVRAYDGEYRIFGRGGTELSELRLQEWSRLATEVGAGEIMVTSIDREGTRAGIDLELVREVTRLLPEVPVIAHGGAGTREHLAEPILEASASAVAAGSQFVMQGGRDSVLINYPSGAQLTDLFQEEREHRSVGVEDDAHIDARYEIPGRDLSTTVMCERCITTSDVPGARLDEGPTCYYCSLHDELDAQYPIGASSTAALHAFAERLKRSGEGKKYDCIIGVSGGTDSSYLAHLLVELGVRPLAVHFDNTWNSPVATSNIYAVLDKLGVDLETYVVDNTEYDDIYRSFIEAGVIDIDTPTDIGFMGVLYRAAEKHGIKHIVEGHSFRTEGIAPRGWIYMDGGYIKSVHRKFGTVPMKTYPNLDFLKFLKWSAFSGIERTRPLYWVDYHKEDAKRFLADRYGWEWYGGHHLENRFSAFCHSYFMPKRFGVNFRQIEFSALIRSGQMERQVAIERFTAPRYPDPQLIELIKKRLGYDDARFDALMTAPKHTYRDYPTYKQWFERLRPLFWVLMKLNRVPKSFYVKFCRP